MIETKNTGLEQTIKDALNLLVQKYGWEDFDVDEIFFRGNININYEDDVYTIDVRPGFAIRPGNKSLDLSVSYADISAETTLMGALLSSLPVPAETYFSVMDSFVSYAMRDALLENRFVPIRRGELTYALDSWSLEKYETPDSLALILEKIKESMLWRFHRLVQDYFDECEENKG